MPKKLFRRWAPDADRIRNHAKLSFLGKLLHDPNLFHLNRHSVSAAFFLGIFISVMPVPGQMAIGAIAAVVFHGNLPITVALTWIGNPFTMPVICYIAYQWGAWLLGSEPLHMQFEFTWEWLIQTLPELWQPLLIGSVTMGLFFGCLGYLAVQWFWRWHVGHKWRVRRRQRDSEADDNRR